jgi:hypothetical protein
MVKASPELMLSGTRLIGFADFIGSRMLALINRTSL